MRLLEQVKCWVKQEAPDNEAIAQTLDNLCYQLAGSTTQSGKAEIEAAISYLLDLHPEPKPEIVRPDAQLSSEPDAGPLFPVDEEGESWEPALSAEEKVEAFTNLKMCFKPH